MRKKQNLHVPQKTVLNFGISPADRIDRPGSDGLRLACAVIVSSDFTTVRAGINNLRIVRVRSDVAALATSDVIPIRAVNAPVRARAGYADGGVILLRPVNVVR